MDTKKQGYIMAAIGFLLLLFNTFGYVLDWESRNVAFTVLGLLFVTIGLKKVRKH